MITLTADTEIIFSANAMDTATDKENLRYLWNFGDNQTGFGQTVLHTYTRSGKYKVKLIALDDNGLYDTYESYIWIDNYYPIVNILDINYGYATYDFSTNDVGEFPDDWFASALEDLYGTTEIVGTIDGFSKVVQVGDGPGFGGIWTSDVIGIPYNQTQPGDLSLEYGSVEFWLYCTDTSQTNFYISLFEDGYQDGIFLEFDNGTWSHDLVPIIFDNSWELQNNTWTHIRLDFCCDDSAYMGLENDTFLVYGDDFSSQILTMFHDNHPDISNITCFGIFSEMTVGEYGKLYVDNIGFSWDPEYEIGDNRIFYVVNQFNEGETIILDCLSYDTFTDYQQLIYNWGDLYLDIGAWEDFGWHYSYVFTDDDDGDELEGYPIVSFIGDPLYAWDIDSYYIDVDNVLPTLSIHSANVIANISAEIYNYGLDAANFTIFLSSAAYNETIFSIDIPTDYPENNIDLNSTLVNLDVSEYWTVIVNQTAREGGTHEVTLNFEFENGYQNQHVFIFDGVESILSFDINDMWIDLGNNISLVPLTFDATLSDPSDDKIDLSIDYIVDIVYEVDFSTPLISKNYTIEHDPFDLSCNFFILEDAGVKYANFRFIEQIQDTWTYNLTSGIFPVSYDFSFNADLTDLDLHVFINDVFSNEGISLVSHESTNYTIFATYNEIEPKSEIQTTEVNYKVNDYFKFQNLAPSISIHAPVNVSEDQFVYYFADVKDFNKDNINVTFSFGINRGSGLKYREPFYLWNNRYGINYTYSNAGYYLIYVNATDGIQETKSIHLIEVVNVLPYAKIRTYQNATYEDEFIKFEADFYDTSSDIQSLRHYWDFGDGVFSAENSPSHAYHQAGDYQIRLHVRDDNGGKFCTIYNLTVMEQPPQIIGPFAFQGLEGQTTILDVAVSDSLSDYLMNYKWDIYNAKRVYEATYDFMEFDEGERPNYSDIEYDSVSNINYRVVDDVSSHYKVLEIHDNNEILGGAWRLRYGDSGSTYGTIEFWLRSTYMAPNEDNIIISLFESSSLTVPITIFQNGTWFYRNLYSGNNTIIENIPLIESNKWHRIRIDFKCSSGGYLNLNENYWRISVDGISSQDLPMQFSTVSPHDDVIFLDTLELKSGGSSISSIYCDAIGYYDSSSQYQIGDNLNQIFYSLDYIKTVYGAKPSVAFDEGSYIIDLLVENEQSSQAEITLEVLNIAPIITVSNKKYYGGKGYIDITAYAIDSYIDYESLEFDWEIEGERVLLESGTLSSSIDIFCDATKSIKGQVTVRDPMDSYASADFMIQAFMDTDGDGYSDEYEVLYNITSPDMDGDGLPNFFEDKFLGTDPLKRDTDDDGLSDGYDDLFYSGELSIGTDPLDNDTDNDLLIDGFEWFGWSCTIVDTQGQKTFNYTSNPLLKDTDGDLLDDYEEFLYKTNPNLVDSDNDGLSDYLEVMVHGSNPNNPDTDADGIIDSIEVEIGTHFNMSDTDGDSIQDGAEYYGWDFITDPLSKDSDHDFLVDTTEHIQYYFKIDGRKDISEPAILSFDEEKPSAAASANMMFLLAYSETTSNELLSDIKVRVYKQDSELILFDETIRTNNIDRYFTRSFEIKDIIENARKSYYGNYILKVSFLDELHGDLSLEEFSITVNKYLDPNNEDYDGDGILDGVETQLIVEGIEVIELLNLNNLTTDTNITTYNTYDFEISDIGFIDSANISFTILSNDTLLGDGHVAVELIQKDLDYRVKDISILSSNITFSSSEVFHENYTVSPLSHDLYKLSGKYQLKINIYDTNEADVFKAIDIKISMDGYRQANTFDTEAWLTKPDNEDSDDDGWTDYYEIYRNHPTNPLSWDTDGDGAKDSADINPLFNMMIEVKFIEGHVGDLPKWYIMAQSKPVLQMTVNYNLHGEALAYISPHVKASKDNEKAGIVFKKKYPGTSVFGHKYYIDIEDDTRSMWLQFKLWDEGLGGIDALWDTKKKTVTKTLLLLGEIQDGKSYDVGSESGTNWLTAKITMKALSHANTIAIYENETLFNGHYNKHQRMNVFQLVVTTIPDPLESPFVLGTNVLLIPTDALLNTELNSILVNGSIPIELEDTFLANGEFISLDREDLPEISSNNVESIFVLECTAAEAIQLLNWALTGMINESANITGIINRFASTKLDGFTVELMNVHLDVLGLVPMINPYPNDDQGSMPKEDGEWWADLAAAILGAIVGFFAAPFVGIIALIALVVYVIVLIIAIVIAAVVLAILAVLEAILLGLILIFVYLMFGISWLISMAILALMALGFAAFADGMQLVFGVTSQVTNQPILPPPSEFEYDGWTMLFDLIDVFEFTSGIRTDFVYSEFMGCSLPTIETFTIADIYCMDFTFRLDFSFSIEGLIITSEGIPLGEDLWEDEGFWTQFLNVLGGTFSICGAFFSLVGGLLAFLDIATGSSTAIISIAGFIVSILIFFLTTLEPANEKGELKTLFFGLALGLLISGVVILLPLNYLKKIPKWLDDLHWYSWQNLLKDSVSVVGMIPFFPPALTQVVIPLATGLFALFTGASMISVIKNDVTKKAFQNVLGMICIGLGIFLLIMALREE
ncbi:MAG: PKD domain-containing protein [Promethearchaeota archaeon]